jgi:hypothetical protein
MKPEIPEHTEPTVGRSRVRAFLHGAKWPVGAFIYVTAVSQTLVWLDLGRWISYSIIVAIPVCSAAGYGLYTKLAARRKKK